MIELPDKGKAIKELALCNNLYVKAFNHSCLNQLSKEITFKRFSLVAKQKKICTVNGDILNVIIKEDTSNRKPISVSVIKDVANH